MSNEDQTELPPIHANMDEWAVIDSHQQVHWCERMMIRIGAIASSLRWKYEIGSPVLSTSSKFRFICRADVSWITDDGVYQTVQALWENNRGQTGLMSAPVEALVAEQPGRFGVGGTFAHLLDGSSAEWLSHLKGGDNDT
jgi:hypothetical protein